MKKTLVVILLSIIAVSSFLYVRSVEEHKNDEKYFYQKLGELKKLKTGSILLTDTTGFEWDEVCVESTYSPLEQNSKLDFYRGQRLVSSFISNQVMFNEKVEEVVFNQKSTVGNSYFYFAGYGTSKQSDGHRKVENSNCSKNGHEMSFDNTVKIALVEKSADKYRGDNKIYSVDFFYNDLPKN